jgi:uncharacterized FlaG/YvyC family protein
MNVDSAATNLALNAFKVQAPSAAPSERASLPAEKPAATQQAPPAENREQSAASSVDALAHTRPSGARFRVDAATKRMVSQVLDENREVMKQIPPEQLLKISANFRKFTALLFDEQA